MLRFVLISSDQAMEGFEVPADEGPHLKTNSHTMPYDLSCRAEAVRNACKFGARSQIPLEGSSMYGWRTV
jgi:hypothetical protein